MAKVNLTTWQRTMLSQIVGEQGGTVEVIANYMPILLKLQLSDADKVLVGWHINPSGNATWSPEKTDTNWDIEFTLEEMRLLKQAVSRYGGWLAANGEQIKDLYNVLKMEWKF